MKVRHKVFVRSEKKSGKSLKLHMLVKRTIRPRLLRIRMHEKGKEMGQGRGGLSLIGLEKEKHALAWS